MEPETRPPLGARFAGPELARGPAAAPRVASGAGSGAEPWRRFAPRLRGPGGGLSPGRCAVRGSESELRPGHGLERGPGCQGTGCDLAAARRVLRGGRG